MRGLADKGDIGDSGDLFLINQRNFDKLPGKQFAYWISRFFISMFDDLPPIDPAGSGRMSNGPAREPLMRRARR